MSTDLYGSQLWSDGAEVDPDNLNNAQRYVQAQVTDQLLQTLIGSIARLTAVNGNGFNDPDFGSQNGANCPGVYAYALNVGGAHLRPGSANHKIQIAPGTLFEKIANCDGLKSTLVPYNFAGTEEFTLTNGDATNPRVDLLQMKLEYVDDTPASVDFQDAVTRALTTNLSASTRHRVQCTLSVKAGTPAASPRIPDPDTDFCAVGSVLVGNGWTSGGNAPGFGIDIAITNQAVVHDQRMPIRVHTGLVDPTAYKLVTAWALNSSNVRVLSSNATNDMYIPCLSPLGRLLAVGWTHFASTAGTKTLGVGGTGLGISNRNTVPAHFSVNDDGDVAVPYYIFEANHAPSAGPTILQSTVNKIGCPLWTNGGRCPVEVQRLCAENKTNFTPTPFQGQLFMRVQNEANSQDWYTTRWWTAVGL